MLLRLESSPLTFVWNPTVYLRLNIVQVMRNSLRHYELRGTNLLHMVHLYPAQQYILPKHVCLDSDPWYLD